MKSQTSGIDYRGLRHLLRNKKWKDADTKTAELMLRVAKRENNEDYLDIERFPIKDLQIVDRLWVKYSNGKYGFSIQKKVWEECGSPTEYGEGWEGFGDHVGWRRENEWLSYSSFVFQPEEIPGTLPVKWARSCGHRVYGWIGFFGWMVLFSCIPPLDHSI